MNTTHKGTTHKSRQIIQSNKNKMWSFCRFSLSLLLCQLSLKKKVHSQKVYPVYYDPNDEPNRNPKGSGYIPVGPEDWDLVNDYSDLYNWEAYSNVELGSNNCTAATSFSNWGSDDLHQQSPIIVSDNPFWSCNDRHTTHDFAGSGCSYKFYTTPYSVRVEFHCDQDWHMDMSRTTTWWNISYVEIKTPSEHVLGNGDGYPGTYTRYPGEMVIAHKGNLFHSDRLSFVSVMLDDSASSGDEDLEPFILGWETFQENQYKNCNVQFASSTCKLTSSRRLGDANKHDSRKFDFEAEMQRKLMQYQAGRKEEDADAEINEDIAEEDLTVDDLIAHVAAQDQRKMTQDYLFPYRLAHKTGPGKCCGSFES